MMNLKVKNEREVTIDDVVAEAEKIYSAASLHFDKNNDSETFLADIRKKHPQFCTSYPIVVRYIAQKQYSSAALRKYLNHIKEHPWKSQDEYLESQADYVMILYKHTAPKSYDRDKQARNIRAAALESLKREHKKFKSDLKNSEKIVENRDKKHTAILQEELKKYIEENREELLKLIEDVE